MPTSTGAESRYQRFKELVDALERKCQTLLSMPPVIALEIPSNTPVGGIYLFSENGRDLYVGRTKRAICIRIRNQFGPNPSAASFPWLIAREATGKRATYTKADSRTALLTDAQFKAAYDQARARIRQMQVRYVHEPDALRQALLEIYVAVATQAKYNDFDTHTPFVLQAATWACEHRGAPTWP